MKLLILGENSLVKLRYISRLISHNFSIISSIYARQLAAITPKKHFVKVPINNADIDYNEPYDGVDIHFRTGTAIRAYRVADELRKRGKTVILSGPHPSAVPDEAKNHADSVLIGNTEELWSDVLNDLEAGKLKPFYKSKGIVKKGAFGISKHDIISKAPIVGVIEATRGCPYKCDFCQDSNVLHGSVFRTRPIEDVINEIKSFPQKFLFFCDVSLTIDPSYTKALFKEMIGLNKKFVCEGNVDVLAKDEELLKLSYEAGCTEWTVGFESFTQEALDDMHKRTNTIGDYFQVVDKVHKFKMAI
ncbi:MAG: radical SAM protein, partial [Thermoplasmatales archaeon]